MFVFNQNLSMARNLALQTHQHTLAQTDAGNCLITCYNIKPIVITPTS